ncbi:hypothetical protein V6S25_17010 [Escherichia coli]|nr:hypothetical protein [Escherichia coli]
MDTTLNGGVPVCAQRRYGVWHCCKQ